MEFQTERLSQSENFCLFIPGALGSEKNIKKIKECLEEVYGSNYFCPPSVFSPDGQRGDFAPPQRFIEMAEILNTVLQERGEIHIIVHSAGATELVKVIEELNKINPSLLTNEEVWQKITLILISPAGLFEKISGSLTFLRNLIRLALTLTPFPSVYKGIESLVIFPPLFFNEETDEEIKKQFFENLRIALPEISLYQGFKELSQPRRKHEILPPKSQYDFEELDQEAKKRLKEIDQELYSLLTNTLTPPTHQKRVYHLLKIRGQLLQKLIDKAYSGWLTEEEKISGLKFFAQSFLGFSRMSILLAMFTGKAYEIAKRMQRLGVKIHGIIPEYDLIVPPQAFEGLTESAVFLTGYGHSTIGPLPQFLPRILDTIREIS